MFLNFFFFFPRTGGQVKEVSPPAVEVILFPVFFPFYLFFLFLFFLAQGVK